MDYSIIRLTNWTVNTYMTSWTRRVNSINIPFRIHSLDTFGTILYLALLFATHVPSYRSARGTGYSVSAAVCIPNQRSQKRSIE